MFADILVVTDRHDLAEESVRHTSARSRRFLNRVRSIVRELLVPTARSPVGVGASGGDSIEVQTENATRHAIDLARSHGARLHVLFVVDAVRYDTTVEFATEPLVTEGEERVAELTNTAERAGVEASGSVVVGHPVEAILDYAAASGVELIVMNDRESSDLLTRIRGSLTAAVIDRSPVPVYVVPTIQPGHAD